MGEIDYKSVLEVEELKNSAARNGQDFDSILLDYFHERFLYRLANSSYQANFILKGDLLVSALSKRKTSKLGQIDFLAIQISTNIDSIKAAVESVCAAPVADDGVGFDVKGITAEQFREGRNQGAYIQIPAKLGTEEKLLHIYISFNGVVVPKPTQITYPILLNKEAPVIYSYSIESIVAEKFEAVLSPIATASGVENFFDLYTLLATQDVDGRALQEAVFETFQRKATPIEREQPIVTEAYVADEERVQQWRTLINEHDYDETISFHEAISHIKNFLSPIYQAILNEDEHFQRWNSKLLVWK